MQIGETVVLSPGAVYPGISPQDTGLIEYIAPTGDLALVAFKKAKYKMPLADIQAYAPDVSDGATLQEYDAAVGKLLFSAPPEDIDDLISAAKFAANLRTELYGKDNA